MSWDAVPLGRERILVLASDDAAALAQHREDQESRGEADVEQDLPSVRWTALSAATGKVAPTPIEWRSGP